MTKEQVAAALAEIGTLLDVRGENPFKVNAYHNAARALEQLDEDLAAVVAEERLGTIKGVGATLRDVITDLVHTGSTPLLDQLRAATPAGLLQMLRIPGLGPKKVKALHDAGISDTAALQAACEAGSVAALKGFGAKTQEKILAGLAFLAQAGTRIRIDQATVLADRALAALREVPGVKRLEACGSLRRRKETIGDIDLLVTATDPAAVMRAFITLPNVTEVISHGDTLSSTMVLVGDRRGSQVRADLRVVKDELFPFALHHFTGSKAHNIALRGRAQARGLKLSEYGLTGPKKSVKCKTEADLFAALGLDDIPPELREDRGEIEAAETHTLPQLVEVKDVRGVFHNHTTESDGAATLEEMVAAARALGFEYLGIADHSQSLIVARGLTPDRVRRQQREIDRLNDTLDGFRVFKGIECDILPDGSLDFDDDVLATFDYVVVSVHTHFGLSREDQTARVVRAVRHPRVTMLGHATGRLLLQRDGYAVDLEAVLQAAAAAGTMVEINAQPSRLDIDWVHCQRAKALGIPLVINPDAHSTDELGLYVYGVDVARRGWLEARDVFNTKSLAEVTSALAARGFARAQ
jgi:DNA polymerase (family 10)